MRILHALKADMKFQFKQGFYYVYLLATLLYIIIIGQFPTKISTFIIPIIIFSDPSLLGFFFIGGIVMLEKVQGILQYIVVTPLRSREYLIAKVISLTIVSELAGFAIGLGAYRGSFNWILLAVGIFLTSVFFTLFGFLVAAGCSTINQYFIKMVPYMLAIIVPCLFIYSFPKSWILDLFPSVVGLKLIYGAFHGMSITKIIVYVLYLGVFDIITLFLVEKYFDRKMIVG